MQHITGTDRRQITFSSLDEQICKDNPVRIIDAFVDKLDLKLLGFVQREPGPEDRPYVEGGRLMMARSFLNSISMATSIACPDLSGVSAAVEGSNGNVCATSKSDGCSTDSLPTTTPLPISGRIIPKHKKTRERDHHLFKKYRTPDCKDCPVKHLCTGRKGGGRELSEANHEYQ